MKKDENNLPYNPTDVDIRRQAFSVGFTMEMIKAGDIDLWDIASFQRKGDIWTVLQKSRLIESLIMRIPLPMFYFDGSEEKWVIIDGLQRLTAIFQFINGNYRLNDLEYLKNLENHFWQDLPFSYRRMIDTAILEAYIINPGTPDKVKLNIFQRINTRGTSLAAQELRNAYYRGKPVELLEELALNINFLRVTNFKITQKNMRDKEVVLRFYSFYYYLDSYEPPMERFLDNSMESIDRLGNDEWRELTLRFDASMRSCQEIFEDNAFYQLNIYGERISQHVNIALFEAWSVNLALLSESQLHNIKSLKSELFQGFLHVLQNVEFQKSISASTSSKKAVQTRFNFVKQLIFGALDA